jgi:hypothetical protein
MQEDSNSPKNALFGYHIQKLYTFIVLWVIIVKLHNEHVFILFASSQSICAQCSRFEQLWVLKLWLIKGPS